MAKERKKLVESVKKATVADKETKADEIIEKLSGVKPKDRGVELSKLTVMIPKPLHDKIKIKAAEQGTKIRKMIIDYLESL